MFPAITAFYAAILGLVLAAFSIWVVLGRVQMGVLHGDGGKDALSRRVRIHGNFTEYVPLILLLIAMLEVSGASHTTLNILLLLLLVSRLMHPIGMFAAVNSPRQFAFRGGGVILTFTVLIATAIMLLVRVA